DLRYRHSLELESCANETDAVAGGHLGVSELPGSCATDQAHQKEHTSQVTCPWTPFRDRSAQGCGFQQGTGAQAGRQTTIRVVLQGACQGPFHEPPCLTARALSLLLTSAGNAESVTGAPRGAMVWPLASQVKAGRKTGLSVTLRPYSEHLYGSRRSAT